MVRIERGCNYGDRDLCDKTTESDGSAGKSITGRHPMVITDTEGKITETNQPFRDLFGTSSPEVTGTELGQYLPERQDTDDTGEQKRHREAFSCELTVETEHGKHRNFTFQAMPFGTAERQSLIGIYIEDTEWRRAEAKAQLLTDVTRRVSGAESVFSGLEQTVEAVCSYTEWRYGEVWVPAETGNYLAFAAGCSTDEQTEQFLTKSTSVTFEYGEGLPGRVYESQTSEWLADASTEPVAVFHRAELARDADLRAGFGIPIIVDQSVVAVLCFFLRERRETDSRLASDITDVISGLGELVKRKQIEQQLKNQNEKLDAFTRTVTHDLRNPLSVAQGYLTLAQKEKSQEPLEKVASALDRMETLIHNLLTLAQEGQAIGAQEVSSISEIARKAWQNVETAGATLDVEDGLILADSIRTQQLFENLFRNCIEHGSTASRPQATENTGTEVAVRVGPLDPVGTVTRFVNDGTAIGFYVEDDGPGIPAHRRGSVFDEEYSTGGSGIGLATVKRIADAHGWESECTESRDGGARFEFIEAEADDDAPAVQTKERHSQQDRIESMTLPAVAQAVCSRRKNLVVYDPPAELFVELRERFSTADIEVTSQRSKAGRAEVAAELHVGETVLATFDAARLREFVPEETVSDDNIPAEKTLLKTFHRRDTASMTAISHEIEDRAHRVGEGKLCVGFQSISNFDDQHHRYEQLATTSLDVHTFAVSTRERFDVEEVTHHSEPTREIARSWFVLYNGGGTDQYKSALVSVETEPELFTGFWTDTPEIVDNLFRVLQSRYEL